MARTGFNQGMADSQKRHATTPDLLWSKLQSLLFMITTCTFSLRKPLLCKRIICSPSIRCCSRSTVFDLCKPILTYLQLPAVHVQQKRPAQLRLAVGCLPQGCIVLSQQRVATSRPSKACSVSSFLYVYSSCFE
jgi:hypothetical protein